MVAPANLIDKVRATLAVEMSGAHVDLQSLNGSGRIWGVVSWQGFTDQDPVDRQAVLWGILRRSLSSDEQNQVSAILTMTPIELKDD